MAGVWSSLGIGLCRGSGILRPTRNQAQEGEGQVCDQGQGQAWDGWPRSQWPLFSPPHYILATWVTKVTSPEIVGVLAAEA